jgi:hypothetical protein
MDAEKGAAIYLCQNILMMRLEISFFSIIS